MLFDVKFVSIAVNAAFDFKYGTTILPDLHVSNRTRISPPLCQTSNPEEKRKIIGDVFVKVIISHIKYFIYIVFNY